MYSLPAFFIFMKQVYSSYTKEDQEVWTILFDRQKANLVDKTPGIYHDCCKELSKALNREAIADFDEVNKLIGKNSWSIYVVPGLIPVEEFFSLLSEYKFCSSTWLRSKKQLDYLEEPDMFHDTFGHIPLLMDPVYAAFMQRFGAIGKNYLGDNVAMTALQRLYWYTIEFGLIKGKQKSLIYGAGIISSFGESNHIYDDPIEIKTFDIEEVINTPFKNDEIQNLYFEIESFDQLFDSLEILEDLLEKGLNITPAIVR